MSKSKHSRLGLGDIAISPSSVYVADHGGGRFTIHFGSLKVETSVEAWHELSEAVWQKYFAALEHKKYLDSLLPAVEDRSTLNRPNRKSVVA